MEEHLKRASQGNQGDYTWTGVLEFMIKEYRGNQLKESEYQLEKKELQDRNSELEGQLKAQESLNEDLMKRIKMLEYGMKRERIKFMALLNKHKTEDREKILQELRRDENVPEDIEKYLSKKKPDVDLPMKRAKRQREFLKKVLKQFDCSDIIEEVFESSVKNPMTEVRNSNQELEIELMNEEGPQEEDEEELEDFFNNNKEGLMGGFNQDLNPNVINSYKKKHGMYSSATDNSPIKSRNRSSLKEVYNCRAHLDSIRELDLIKDNSAIVSCGDDSIVRVFDIEDLNNLKKSENYFSGNEDAFPIFTVSGREQDSIFVTGGVEGVVRLWEFTGDQIKELDNSIEIDEVIWSVRLHQTENFILTSAANGTLKCWGIIVNQEDGNLCFSDVNSGIGFELEDKIPTGISWGHRNKNSFAVGFADEACIGIFDIESSKASAIIGYNSNKLSQVNKVVSEEVTGNFYAGCEDGFVRIFDERSNKIVKEWMTHSDCTTGLDVSRDSFTLASCGHDGAVKLWDLRNYEIIAEKKCHFRKYDEIINDVILLEDKNVVISAGADGSFIVHEIN